MNKLTRNKLADNILLAIFSAVLMLFTIVPNIGFISLPFLPIGFTILHIFVIIGVIIGGRKYGIVLGLVFGLSSLYVALTRPSGLLDVFFQNPLISVLPRFLFGITTYYIYEYSKRLYKKSTVGYLLLVVTLIGVGLLFYYSIMTLLINWNVYLLIGISVLVVILLLITMLKVETETASIFTTAILGTLVHTFFVLGSLYIIYFDKVSSVLETNKSTLESLHIPTEVLQFLFYVVGTNALVEAIAAGFIVVLVTRPLLRFIGIKEGRV